MYHVHDILDKFVADNVMILQEINCPPTQPWPPLINQCPRSHTGSELHHSTTCLWTTILV